MAASRQCKGTWHTLGQQFASWRLRPMSARLVVTRSILKRPAPKKKDRHHPIDMQHERPNEKFKSMKKKRMPEEAVEGGITGDPVLFGETREMIQDLISIGLLEEAETACRQLTEAVAQAASEADENSQILYKQLLVRERFVLAGILADLEKLEEAQETYRDVVLTCIALHGDKHVGSNAAMHNHATVLQQLRHFDEAEALYRRVLDHAKDAQRVALVGNLADLLRETGDVDAAIALIDRELPGRQPGANIPPTIRLKFSAQVVILEHASCIVDRAGAKSRLAAVVAEMRDQLGDASPLTRKYSELLANFARLQDGTLDSHQI